MSKAKPLAIGFMPDRWEGGVVGLSHDAEYVYFRLCAAMMATGDGVPLADGPAVCRFFPRYKRALDELLRKGKVYERDGELWNDRAIAEHRSAVESRRRASDKGKGGANSRWGSTGNSTGIAQAPSQAPPQPMPGDCTGNSTPTPTPTQEEPETPQSSSTALSPPARDPPAENAAALRLIEAFDAAIVTVFGEQQGRPWAHQTDLSAARRMLDAGLAPDDAPLLFEALCRRMHDAGKQPPRALRYAEGAVGDHVAALTRGLPMPDMPAFLDRRPKAPAEPSVDAILGEPT